MNIANNKKGCLMYLAYTLAVITIGLAGNEYLMTLRERYFIQILNAKWLLSLYVLYPILFGMLIVLPSFVNQLKKPGPWKIDWIKLIGIGLPTLVVAVFELIRFYSFNYLSGGAAEITALLGRAPSLQVICGAIFGYLFLSAFYKGGKNTDPVHEDKNLPTEG